jgi:hypothetical protein
MGMPFLRRPLATTVNIPLLVPRLTSVALAAKLLELIVASANANIPLTRAFMGCLLRRLCGNVHASAIQLIFQDFSRDALVTPIARRAAKVSPRPADEVVMNQTRLILASAALLIGCGGEVAPEATQQAAIDTVTYVGTPPTAAPLNHADTANVTSAPAAPVTFAGTARPDTASIDRSDLAQPGTVSAHFAPAGTDPTPALFDDSDPNVAPRFPQNP